ncbi:hypothetical protein ABGB17_26055 [Sphaerisporangium sp. B11E5]|uniref:hypothetical protein n=1 Tax=Sphaerisporangium sp. B11E5 TaxID=3153563 RepID=UPI00325E3E0D
MRSGPSRADPGGTSPYGSTTLTAPGTPPYLDHPPPYDGADITAPGDPPYRRRSHGHVR